MATRWKSPSGVKVVLPDLIEPGPGWEFSGRPHDTEINMAGVTVWSQGSSGKRAIGLRDTPPPGKGWTLLGPIESLPTTEWPTDSTSTSIHEAMWGSSSARDRARSVASVVEGASWVFLAVGVLLGVWVALHKDSSPQSVRSVNVAIGAGIAVGAAFFALVVIMVATYIQARMDDQPGPPGL